MSKSYQLVNTGHNLNIIPGAVSSLRYNNVHYKLLQVHAHAYSEHSFDGSFTALELHLVHQRVSIPSQLLVIGVPLRLDDNDVPLPFVDAFFQISELPEAGHSVTVEKDLDVYSLLQSPGRNATKYLYTYPGSLTTPTCSENVQWVALEPRFAPSVAVQQLFGFEYLFSVLSKGVPLSARLPQPLKKRKVNRFVATL